MQTYILPNNLMNLYLLPNGGFISGFDNASGYVILSPAHEPIITQKIGCIQVRLGILSFYSPPYNGKNYSFFDNHGNLSKTPILQIHPPQSNNDKYALAAYPENNDNILQLITGLHDGGIIVLDKKTKQYKTFTTPAKWAYFNVNSQIILAINDKTIYLIDNPFEADAP